MLKKLRLERFKNFKEAELILGPLTLLVGTNASGKSNIRDAFRFLHGISRNYSFAEIFGEKWIEGGVLQWRGIRGGTREATFQGAKSFAIDASFSVKEGTDDPKAIYQIEVDLGTNSQAPSLISERLTIAGQEDNFFEAESVSSQGQRNLIVKVLNRPITNSPTPFTPNRPIVSQLAELATDISIEEKAFVPGSSIRGFAKATLQAFSSMRFLDLNPDAMRLPSLPGQTILGDRGENLSSVLQKICENPESKQALLQWVQELTPMDAMDFEFPADFTGKILLTLIEENGQKTSAISASDGTLRFLAMIAALLGPEPARFYFFEELDNGIHPTRLHLLLQLIERKVSQGTIQVVATTHSPQLLRLLSSQSLEYASLTYRLGDRLDAQIKRIVDIPEARRVIHEQDLARLHESGWLEDAMEFLEEEDTIA
ncbi:AAA family ATPase [Iningainema tapete]|uniref:AAA family ATPase n=1 Tax=Iningainema tapete BLCC-T55 TaxID=2748662 RepID=A0A8J7BW79_9CYAN|nr:ATP-binding protein [Iningainema tapete]MBD2771302.1 AAA family ATPase [Iningainema tapete BLCC-T55]